MSAWTLMTTNASIFSTNFGSHLSKSRNTTSRLLKEIWRRRKNASANLLKRTWAKRGIYPSLNRVLDIFIEDPEISEALAIAVKGRLTAKYDLLTFFADVVSEKVGADLEDFEDDLRGLAEKRTFKKHQRALAKLSLFLLTSHQIRRIIDDK